MTTDPFNPRRALPADATVARWRAADGWPVRRFDRAGGTRGSILFLGGRADVFEKYLETLDHWHRAGWSVSSFDWRGQGGSGRMSPDPLVGHATDFAPLVDDLAGFWRDWAGTRAGPHVVVGHSMGGYLVLRALVERRIAADAAVLVAPMLGLRSPLGAWGGGRLAAFLRDRGDPARGAWRLRDDPAARTRRQRRLTADVTRFDDEDWWYAQDPAIRLGPPSWAWIAEAFAATARLRADPRLRFVATPTLMLVAERDRLVDTRAARAVAARLPHARLARFDSAHEILREADAVRDRALAAIDGFLDEVAT
ncbi:lysophospholipase [Sphingomonas sp. Leaf412]|uniref:alpha/beta fold hydrolase n=1 Tax=Sphingomonas sp. Leaf412 TaxID=1736370 RepID=UPI0006F7E278|nr:alpha/beta hydrolase [Sphingomonas sp. Leaf412]KQT31729.1 lysophospholipase [Sphingomonas sp. Leaf412]